MTNHLTGKATMTPPVRHLTANPPTLLLLAVMILSGLVIYVAGLAWMVTGYRICAAIWLAAFLAHSLRARKEATR